MLKDPDPDFVREITNSDITICNQLAKDPSLLIKTETLGHGFGPY